MKERIRMDGRRVEGREERKEGREEGETDG